MSSWYEVDLVSYNLCFPYQTFPRKEKENILGKPHACKIPKISSHPRHIKDFYFCNIVWLNYFFQTRQTLDFDSVMSSSSST